GTIGAGISGPMIDGPSSTGFLFGRLAMFGGVRSPGFGNCAPGAKMIGLIGLAVMIFGAASGFAASGSAIVVSGNSGVVTTGAGVERQPSAIVNPPSASNRTDHFRAMTHPQ